MSQTPVTVTYSLEEVLKQINQKLDTLNKEVSEFKTVTKVAIESVKGDINSVKGDIKALDARLTNVENDIKEIKGSQRTQIWALIGILGTALLGTVARYLVFSNTP